MPRKKLSTHRNEESRRRQKQSKHRQKESTRRNKESTRHIKLSRRRNVLATARITLCRPCEAVAICHNLVGAGLVPARIARNAMSRHRLRRSGQPQGLPLHQF